MKKLFFAAAILFSAILTSCNIQQQTQKIMAFQKCKYDFTSLSGLTIAGTPIQSLTGSNGLDIAKAPRIALAVLRKDVPLEATVNLKIQNPSANPAGINEFDYILLLQNRELTTGTVSQPIEVPANGGVSTVPIKVSLNIINLLTDKEAQKDISDFVSALSNHDATGKSLITIKLKPSFGIGNSKIKYPGYITISKDVSKKILL